MIYKLIGFVVRYWWQILFFGLAVILDTFKDALTFYYPYDNGFWSLHTGPNKFDAWHVSKLLMWGCVVAGMMSREAIRKSKWYILAVFSAVNYVLHEYFLHKVFKPKK